MPKIRKPDGHRTPRFTKAQGRKLRYKALGLYQDGTPRPKQTIPFAAMVTGIAKHGSYPGPYWKVVLSCGHSSVITLDERQQQGLFEGKMVACDECKIQAEQKAYLDRVGAVTKDDIEAALRRMSELQAEVENA